MSTATLERWQEANQRYLVAALAVLHERLRAHAAPPAQEEVTGGDPDDAMRAASESLAGIRAAMDSPPALEALAIGFGLSGFERDVLLLCAGMELDTSFRALASELAGTTAATFALALAVLPDAHWSALTPSAPLRRWRLVELASSESVTASQLRIDERVLHYLTGAGTFDERLAGYVERADPAGDIPASQQALAARIADAWVHGQAQGAFPMIQLCGVERHGKRSVAAAAAAGTGMGVLAMYGADLPASLAEREALARLCEREAILSGSAIYIDCEELDDAVQLRNAIAFAESLSGPVVLAAREPVRLRGRAGMRLEVRKPSAAEQLSLWHAELGPLAVRLNGAIESVVAQFDLGIGGIREASAEIAGWGDAESLDIEDCERVLWDACRAHSRPRMEDLAQRIVPAATWDDLVLPEAQMEMLREIAAHVRQRATVYHRWGFAARSSRGLGIGALFAGSSGTGKTMAAEVLAAELDLDLYRIDLSQVISKYIGETEKNLRRVFDAAEDGGAILLFDEADALFGKRSDVKDSRDRYANIEVGYLLQRVEAYRGLAILTTNMRGALDPAFIRRIRFMIQFSFPDAAQRSEIWRRIFPPETPTDGIDHERLGQLNVAGGNIRNIALGAAFMAADAGEPVRMRHLLHAARGEYDKLEKQLSSTEVRGWI